MPGKSTLLLTIALAFIQTHIGISQEQHKYWIFLKDKGPATVAKVAQAREAVLNRLSDRALARRRLRLPPDALIDAHDLDVYSPYIAALAARGVRVLVASRWLNAVSARLTRPQAEALQALPFVRSTTPVHKMARPRPRSGEVPFVAKGRADTTRNSLNYGLSLLQNAQIQVNALHNAEIFGEHVTVGVLDAGFRLAQHIAFDSLRVLGEFDFVNGDSITANQEGDRADQDNHGTNTLSVIAGYAPGNLIGPAFKAAFLLAKTEDLASETHEEEDNWVRAIEWMEQEGVDVTSTSLGYQDFDAPSVDYTYEDMDGKTAIITRAAQIAMSKGVVVVTSAGNSGNNSKFPYISAPADGADVLAVGAVNAQREKVNFSSIGPTADGRIKPDVTALGVQVVAAQAGTFDGFVQVRGTSFSCPLVAGVAALILSAHPHLTPLQVNEAIRMTASHAQAPDNLTGYGIVDARAAIAYWGPAVSDRYHLALLPDGRFRLAVRVLVGRDEFVKSLELHYRPAGTTAFETMPMTQVDSTLFLSEPFAVPRAEDLEVYFSTQIPAKGIYTYPNDAPQSILTFQEHGRMVGEMVEPPVPQFFRLEQNYPNPVFQSNKTGTTIRLQLLKPAAVRVIVYNQLGQEVARIMDLRAPRTGELETTWNGRMKSGRQASPGVYFYRAEFFDLDGRKQTITRKLAVLK